jgi:hypothetical protein
MYIRYNRHVIILADVGKNPKALLEPWSPIGIKRGAVGLVKG